MVAIKSFPDRTMKTSPTGKDLVEVYPMVTTMMGNIATPRLTQTIQKLIGLYWELVATIILLLQVLYVCVVGPWPDIVKHCVSRNEVPCHEYLSIPVLRSCTSAGGQL